MRSNLDKKALFSAFLFACTILPTSLRADDCRLPGTPEPAEIAAVLDGDTVRLADNRRVRLLAFGTLEVDHEHPERSTALALEARKTLQYLLPKGARTYVSPPGPIAPGEAASLTATVETPTATGRYTMTVTVIRNGVDDPAPGFEKSIRVDKGR